MSSEIFIPAEKIHFSSLMFSVLQIVFLSFSDYLIVIYYICIFNIFDILFAGKLLDYLIFIILPPWPSHSTARLVMMMGAHFIGCFISYHIYTRKLISILSYKHCVLYIIYSLYYNHKLSCKSRCWNIFINTIEK